MQKAKEIKLNSCRNNNVIRAIIDNIALIWSIFQILIASPVLIWLSAHLGFVAVLLNDFQLRLIHLSFALFLTFLSSSEPYSQHNKISVINWTLALISSFLVLYLFIFYEELAVRVAMPTNIDLIISIAGILLLLEAARRTVGMPIVIISSIFLLYSYFGQYMPIIVAHKGNSLSAIASHEWLSSEGVFGVALATSANFIFLYVLFGALLEKAGGGEFFIKLSFALLARFTGGPAKAAVVASGLMGMISGSSMANTITIGTFTIPLMKKMGLSAEKAAAIEVSAGVNAQIMPPVMGAAAFLISEFLSIPYALIVKYAIVPAILIYITLLYIVHLEACKLNANIGDDMNKKTNFNYYTLLTSLISICCFIIFCGVIYFVIQGIYHFLGATGYSIYPISLLVISIYVLTLWYQSQYEKSDSNSLRQTLISGLHYFIPVSILIWCLTIEKMSSALSCYWTIIFLIFMLLTKDIITSFFRKEKVNIASKLKSNLNNLREAMVIGAKNMIPVAIATGTAGVLVGSVSLTGFGLSIGNLIENLANGSLLITLILTAIICIILGMGMPTTACYIVVSTLMIPILNHIIQLNEFDIAQIALHLFVFYFGLMADVTPPVGLASYAAAAIAQANAFKVGIQAFLYNIRTMLVPFAFVFNNELILYKIKSVPHSICTIITSLIGLIAISSGMQGYFIRVSKFYESVLLFMVGFILLFPRAIVAFVPVHTGYAYALCGIILLSVIFLQNRFKGTSKCLMS